MVSTPDQMEQGFRHADNLPNVSNHLNLSGRPLDLQLSKNDFTIILLRSLGPTHVSSALVNDLFEQIDDDNNGFINEDELLNFLRTEGGALNSGMYSNYMIKRLAHVSNLGSSMFVCGSSLSIMNNLWKRSHESEGVMLAVSYLIMWLFLIGSALFAGDFVRNTIKRLRGEGVKSLPLMMQLLRYNLSSFEQMINLMWLLGSLLYVLAIHSKQLNLSSATTSRLWVIGGTSYLIGGFLALPYIYRNTSDKMNQQQEMLQKIHGVIEIHRRISSASLDSDTIIKCPEQLIDIRPKSRRTLSESLIQPMHDRPSHRRQCTCPVMVHIELDTDTFTHMKAVQECSEESFKTLDTESLTWSEDDSLSKRKSESERSLTNITPAYDEVYASLSSNNPVNVDMFVRVLNRMNEDVVGKVNSLKLCQDIAMTSGFHIALLYTVAGILFTIGAIDSGLPKSAVQNMFFAGSCIYFCGGVFGLYKVWTAARSSWDSMQSVITALQQYYFVRLKESEAIPDISYPEVIENLVA